MPTSFGVLGTYPPTQCGLATFSQSLTRALRRPGEPVGVVSVVDSPLRQPDPDVTHQWVTGSPGGAAAAAAALGAHDVAVVQHEYGIYGGRDGEDVLDVVRALRVPAIVVLHTVLVTPTARQRSIVEELARRCAAVVTMTRTGRDRLLRHYAVNPYRVHVIPHGAADVVTGPEAGSGAVAGRPPVVLTWGLLGEGKGIEWAIDAMARLTDLDPGPQYHVVGQTHPKVKARDGERYREGLQARAQRKNVAGAVHFDSRYLASPALQQLVREADVVLLPYDSPEQVTSGVLIEAVAAGKPVVATRFPHAMELLSSGAGLLVDRKDPEAIAAALRRVLTEPGLAAGMSAQAHRISPGLQWSAVAGQYRTLAAGALRAGGRTTSLAVA